MKTRVYIKILKQIEWCYHDKNFGIYQLLKHEIKLEDCEEFEEVIKNKIHLISIIIIILRIRI